MREPLRLECQATLEGSLESSLEGSLGDMRIVEARALCGGDASAVFELRSSSCTLCIAKVQPAPDPARRSQCEADGLQWLRSFGVVSVPRVLGITPSGVLLLEAVASSPPSPAAETRFGEALAALHSSPTTAGFGYPCDNYVGALSQRNTATPSWAAFYAEHRIGPLVDRCIERGTLPSSCRSLLDRLAARLPDLCAPLEPPSPLHGDLWSGNVLWTAEGAVLIDPAVYAGHREIDLAMMHLFGGFGPRVFDAYESCAPLARDHKDRIELFQLYPVLVHAVLFDSCAGGGYAASAQRTLQRYA